jgi:RNA polymerase sigma-70 factor (ECF subfamily)
MTDADTAHRAAERAARSSYGRLLAFLIARFGDVESAEDALASAFAAALETWPRTGVPASPEAWLMTAAKRNLLMGVRHQQVRDVFAEASRHAQPETTSEVASLPDKRLELLFACAHPVIDESARLPLMLQTILGLEARQIAPALLVSPTAMAQRLVRAKAALREEHVPFEIPSGTDREPRLFSVLEAIYAAYGLSLDGIAVAGDAASEMRGEALYLARLVADLMPQHPEPPGLVALILFCESRTRARISAEGAFVPLHSQDTAQWDRAQIAEAERLLAQASAFRSPGPFQLEAAIQSAHTQRAFTGRVPWAGIARLYEALTICAPTVGSRVGQAVAVGESEGPDAGLRLLAALEQTESKRLAAHQPFWVARAELLFRQGDVAPAIVSMERALGLSERTEIRAYLSERLREFRRRT